jgi:hypothetical protein
MSGSFDNLPRLQSLDEGEYGKISAGLRPPHSIFTVPDSLRNELFEKEPLSQEAPTH